MSTNDGDDTEVPKTSVPNPVVDEGEQNAATDQQAKGNDLEGDSKIVFLLRAAGGAPMLKKRRWTLPRTRTMGHIVEFLKKYMQLDPQESPQLFLYVNQSFAPALDTTIGSVSDCFSSEGVLVLHYALTQAWG